MKMFKNFTERLQHIIQQRQSHLCVGIDPELDKLPKGIPRSSEGLLQFCNEIIQATAEFAAAFKINFAFFEALGQAGWRALAQVAALLPESTIRIADAKRGDIGNSAKHYARAILHELPFDCLTVNPYLGEDAAAPFLDNPAKGAFFLCHTSNPSAREIQHFPDRTQPLYLHVAARVGEWNRNKNCGLVVGATHAEELKQVRKVCPDLPFLIPGIGAQDGDLKTSVIVGTAGGKAPTLINVSRAIIFSGDDKNFATAAAKAAQKFQRDIQSAIDESVS
jgi:orotidine-5'-phosphate decarboxylase